MKSEGSECRGRREGNSFVTLSMCLRLANCVSPGEHNNCEDRKIGENTFKVGLEEYESKLEMKS